MTETPAPQTRAEPPPSSGAVAPLRRRGFARRFFSNPQAVASAAVLLTIIVLVALAPLLTPFAPDASRLRSAFGPPGDGHLLGFDSAGRDVWSRLLHGGRTTLGGAAFAVLVAMAVGVPSGLAAGYYGGWFDRLSSWWVNLVMALPAMVVLLASRAVLGPTVWALMIVLGLLVSPAFFRLVRGSVVAVRGELYMDAARVFGLSDLRIIARHVLPVVRAPLMIQASLVAGMAIGLQAGLEFLGIGSGTTPTWGAMLNEAFLNIQRAPLFMLWPALALGLTSACLVLLASGLRDVVEEGGAPAAGRRGRRPPAPAAATAAAGYGTGADRAGLLSVRGLSVAFGGGEAERTVVHRIDLDVAPGEVVGLVGESGSGKSLSAFSVLGLLPRGGRVAEGSILLEGTELTGAGAAALNRLRGTTIGYVPQEPMSNLDPCFTIGDQLTEPLRVRGGLGRGAARERARELLRQVDIAEPDRVMAAYPHQVSGGMAQRVLIAGAISLGPALLIADEPTTALDVTVQADVLTLLRRLQTERGMGLLLVTHNLGVVADLCDRVAVVNGGRIVETGTAAQILTEPRDSYTRRLLDAALDDVAPRPPWTPPQVGHDGQEARA